MITNQEIALERWRDHPRNYNAHPDDQIQDLVQSLQAFGQVQSVVAQAQPDGSLLGVAGHGVVAAARRLGMATLRADVIPDDWTEAEVLAYLAASNELARRSTPDMVQLAAMAEELARLDPGLGALAAGGEEALAQLMAFHQAELGDPAEESARRAQRLGQGKLHIKPVLAVEQLATFELALRATGLSNRAEALLAICREYLERRHEPDSGHQG